MKIKLSTKTFMGICGILLAVCLLLFGALQFFLPRQYATDQLTRFANGLYSLTEQLAAAPQEKWQSMVQDFCTDYQCILDIEDSRGNIIATASGAYAITPDGQDVFSQVDESFSTSMLFTQGGDEYHALGVAGAVEAEQIKMLFPDIFPYFLVFIVVVSTGVAWLYSRMLTRPIVEISEISRKMAGLDLSWSCNEGRKDELGDLAANMNTMSANLGKALTDLQSANDQLMDDIEAEKRREKQRRDFFAAVSHELKTPITILKGELDGMIHNVGEFKDRDKYLRESYETVEDVETLIREIISLARIDDISLAIEMFDMVELAKDVVDMYGDIIKEKGLELECVYNDEVPCMGDRMHIRTVLSNVIGNAVFHSPEQAPIRLQITDDGATGCFAIENEAERIDDVDMENIFEPFYRIDKSRSRHTGGSGLGLYIVKAILELHCFGYSIHNTPRGIIFQMHFPMN